MKHLNWKKIVLSGSVWFLGYNLLMAVAWFAILKEHGIDSFHPILGSGGHLHDLSKLPVLFVTLFMGMFSAWLYAVVLPPARRSLRSAMYVAVALWLNWGVLPNCDAQPKNALAVELISKLAVISAATAVMAISYGREEGLIS